MNRPFHSCRAWRKIHGTHLGEISEPFFSFESTIAYKTRAAGAAFAGRSLGAQNRHGARADRSWPAGNCLYDGHDYDGSPTQERPPESHRGKSCIPLLSCSHQGGVAETGGRTGDPATACLWPRIVTLVYLVEAVTDHDKQLLDELQQLVENKRRELRDQEKD